MKRAALALGPFVLLLVPFVSAQSLETQSGASVWDVLVAPSMDPEKSAVTENVDIVRDRVHITLVSGSIQFAKPANGEYSTYFPALGVIGGSGKMGRRFGSPRAPRTSTSSKSREGATTAAGRPLCALPNAPSAVPAMPFTWLCI